MPDATPLIATCVPGLALRRGWQDVIHLASGVRVLTLPELSRQEATGVPAGGGAGEDHFGGALTPLGVLDWEGTLTPEHDALLARHGGAYASAEGTRALMTRTARIVAALRGAYRRFWWSERARRLNAAHTAQGTAQRLREAATTPSEKAAATRAEGAARAALEHAELSAELLERLRDPERPVARWIACLNRQQAHLREVRGEQQTRVRLGRIDATTFLNAQRGSPLGTELRLCLSMTCGYGELRSAWTRRQQGAAGEESDLARANRERTRRREARLPLTGADPEVRALTRPARLAAGNQVMNACRQGQTPEQQQFHAFARDLLTAGQFKTRAVRRARLDAVLTRLEVAYPEPARFRAALRGCLKTIQKRAERYHYRPLDPAELPGTARWTPAPPPPPRRAVIQPTLF